MINTNKHSTLYFHIKDVQKKQKNKNKIPLETLNLFVEDSLVSYTPEK